MIAVPKGGERIWSMVNNYMVPSYASVYVCLCVLMCAIMTATVFAVEKNRLYFLVTS